MDIKKEIIKLKEEKGAKILAHYYQLPEIQDIADVVGDSYYLSKIAKECKEQLIVFCGVKFMGESAKILSPEKTILLPALDATCPMAEMARVEDVLELKEKHPDSAIVSYINSTAEVKAISDVCVTSSNAVRIIKKIKEKTILFLPDKNMGAYLQEQIPEKEFILWNGFCITHKKVTKENILKSKEIIKNIKVLVHPECEKDSRDLADFLGSTGEMIEFVTKNNFENYLVVTEEGVLHQMKQKNPNKNFYVPGNTLTCVNMKKTRLQDVYESLLDESGKIELDEGLRKKAYAALAKMHEMGR